VPGLSAVLRAGCEGVSALPGGGESSSRRTLDAKQSTLALVSRVGSLLATCRDGLSALPTGLYCDVLRCLTTGSRNQR
jgi:hypothetical protein